jgi:hypothetical protein
VGLETRETRSDPERFPFVSLLVVMVFEIIFLLLFFNVPLALRTPQGEAFGNGNECAPSIFSV